MGDMATYTVHLTTTLSTAVTVEADSPEAAMDIAWESPDFPGSMSYGAFSGAAVDESGEWEPRAVTDESGDEVWSDRKSD